VSVGVKQVERLTERIGHERQQERDTAVDAYRTRTLTQRAELPPDVTAPAVAVVEMDGGRLQIRTAFQEPCHSPQQTEVAATATTTAPNALAEADAAAVPTDPAAPSDDPLGGPDRAGRSPHWREDKVGCLLSMSSVVSLVDPCPDIPCGFIDPLGALKLAQQIGHAAVPPGASFVTAVAPTDVTDKTAAATRPGQPELVARQVVASRQDIHAFGPLLASAAWARGLFGAPRRAFVADGSSENWSVWQRYFPRWTGVLDFVHALTYVYAAAMAGRTFAEGWPVYERWIRWVWAGQVSRAIQELTARRQEVGKATQEDKEGSVRRVVQETLTYLSNQQDRMVYDAYRKEGLPLMSSYVESVVKQINYRVKGTEKFWTEAGAEALLQLRADYLSDDEPLDGFWQRRQKSASGQRRYRRAG